MRRDAAIEAEALFAAGALEPDLVSLDLDNLVTLDLVALAVDAVVDDGQGAARGLGPNRLQLPGTHRRIGVDILDLQIGRVGREDEEGVALRPVDPAVKV